MAGSGSFHNKVLAFNPLEGFQPQDEAEAQMKLHIEQLLSNLSIAAQNLDGLIYLRKKQGA